MDRDKKKTKKEDVAAHVIRHLIGYSILLSVAVGGVPLLFSGSRFYQVLVQSILLGLLFVYPVVLTILNLWFLFSGTGNKKYMEKGRQIELITIGLGSFYSIMILPFYEIRPDDWMAALSNRELHTPIWTQGGLTIFVLAGIGIAGYVFLSVVDINRVPPLVTVCAMSSMDLGVAVSILWIVQIAGREFLPLCLLPFNCIILAAKTVRYKMKQWNTGQETKALKNRFLNRLNQRLVYAGRWPAAAFLLMWPLLGILICILVLFGQQPDSVIKAWTETSDWNLSQRVSPQNIIYDEHYLCTVAAGGHKGLVKPIRLGERHGHTVVVNRQLMIANAFEEVLKERAPGFHRRVRRFYDTYGFPVARLIHSPYTADMIYLLMKPLEWLFLAVLYFCDVNPENRIALQYLPKESVLKQADA